jgi:arylsulfatase
MTSSRGRYAGQDKGWIGALIFPVMIDFNKSIMKYPSIKRFPGGASTDLIPDLQHPENPAPLLKDAVKNMKGKDPRSIGGGG